MIKISKGTVIIMCGWMRRVSSFYREVNIPITSSCRTETEMTEGEGEGPPQGSGHAQGHAQVRGVGIALEGHGRGAVTGAASMMTGGGGRLYPRGYWLCLY